MSVMECYLLRKENIVIAAHQLGDSTHYKHSERFFDPVTSQLSVECRTKAKAWPCALLQILARQRIRGEFSNSSRFFLATNSGWWRMSEYLVSTVTGILSY